MCTYYVGMEAPIKLKLKWSGKIFNFWDKNIDVSNESIFYQQIQALMMKKARKKYEQPTHIRPDIILSYSHLGWRLTHTIQV